MKELLHWSFPAFPFFSWKKDAFGTYSRKAGRKVQFPDDRAGTIISCAMESKEAVDAVSEKAPEYGGAASGKAVMDETSGGYIGYFSDPDGYLWELVYPVSDAENEHAEIP